MKKILLLTLVCIAAVAISACRIGGGFDGEGRLVSRNKPEPVKTDPAIKPEPAKAAPQQATIVYLIPAG